MTAYTAPLADIRFVLEHIGGLPAVGALPGLEHASPDVVDAVLEEAAKLAGNVLAPLNQSGDREGAVLKNGVVRTAGGFRDAYRTYAIGGWMGLAFPEALGGQDLPWLVNTATAEIWSAANLSFQLCPLLTQGAIDAILHHGSDEQRQVYATKLISGDWTGAMCLTEPQAGSDLGTVRTRAVKDGDRYRIFGTKIFITYGEHDLADNIVHLVLARLDGAPAGTRGISLFIVPKFLPTPDGGVGPRNDLRCVSLEHKLGINASPTCVMAYGDGDGAVGFLLGEENQGLRCMFTMMNNARLSVGHQGLGLAERAYQQALVYARARVQGSQAIVNYPDVRRMLLTMRAQIAAMRALCYWTAGFVDRSVRAADPAERAVAADRVALLTPMVKAWCTDLAQEIASTAVQVHGGMGFIEETGAAQHYRDAKILSIYEGTNGIQAMDLVGRKLRTAEGQLPWLLIGELRMELSEVDGAFKVPLTAAVDALERTTRHLQADTDDRGSGASGYLRLFATSLGAFLLARGARAAPPAAADGGSDWPGLANVFLTSVLPPALALETQILAGRDALDASLLSAAR